MFIAFQLCVDLLHGLIQQEETAGEHDDIAEIEAYVPVSDVQTKQLTAAIGHEPAQCHQQEYAGCDACDHPDPSGGQAFFGRESSHQDGNKDHVIDPQYDLQQCKGDQAHHGVVSQQMFHKCLSVILYLYQNRCIRLQQVIHSSAGHGRYSLRPTVLRTRIPSRSAPVRRRPPFSPGRHRR